MSPTDSPRCSSRRPPSVSSYPCARRERHSGPLGLVCAGRSPELREERRGGRRGGPADSPAASAHLCGHRLPNVRSGVAHCGPGAAPAPTTRAAVKPSLSFFQNVRLCCSEECRRRTRARGVPPPLCSALHRQDDPMSTSGRPGWARGVSSPFLRRVQRVTQKNCAARLDNRARWAVRGVTAPARIPPDTPSWRVLTASGR